MKGSARDQQALRREVAHLRQVNRILIDDTIRLVEVERDNALLRAQNGLMRHELANAVKKMPEQSARELIARIVRFLDG